MFVYRHNFFYTQLFRLFLTSAFHCCYTISWLVGDWPEDAGTARQKRTKQWCAKILWQVLWTISFNIKLNKCVYSLTIITFYAGIVRFSYITISLSFVYIFAASDNTIPETVVYTYWLSYLCSFVPITLLRGHKNYIHAIIIDN